MIALSQDDIGHLLDAWSQGEKSALDKLVPIVYAELRRLASHYLRHEHSGYSLQATALVNEAYVRLTDYKQMKCESRLHFVAVAAQVMRRILVEHARRRRQRKRGGMVIFIPLDEVTGHSDRSQDLVAVDRALRQLAAVDERKSRVVELRFFGGLSVEEVSEVLKVSAPTVMRDWNTAKAWLYRELHDRSDR